MCGLVGILGRGLGRETDPIGTALGLLAPRGPDAAGREESRVGSQPLALGVRRLGLLDPLRGRQPILRPSGAVLAWNGEVYNHEELRRELAAQGEPFHSRSDGEVLAALLDRDGTDGLARVEGSYALAFRQAPDGPLFLARDPNGVRPLCYAERADTFVFASTVEALLATGLVEARADLEGLIGVMRDGVVSSTRTAVAGVSKVAPGEILRVDERLRVQRMPVPERAAEDGPPMDLLEALRAAVRDRLALDRPWGLFLSGGIDSAVVAALAAERATASGVVPRAFTAAFPGYAEGDETRRAQRTARRLGLEHTVVPCPRDPTVWVLGAARAFDEPFADASAVPTWGLAREAGRSARAVLTGTGGDEVLGGYRRYWLLGAGPWLRFVPTGIRAPVAAVLSRTAPSGARLIRASTDPEGLYRGLLRIRPLEETRELLGPVLAQVDDPPRARGPRTAREAMANDFSRYLPEDLLVKEDRALMAHGVEGRHPFLDHRVRRAAAGLELRGAPGRGRQKQVLRSFVREVVDPDLARGSKRGFAFPVDDFYRGPLKPLAQEILGSQRARSRGFISPPAVRRLIRDHGTGSRNAGAVIHALVMLELWARRVLDSDALIP